MNKLLGKFDENQQNHPKSPKMAKCGRKMGFNFFGAVLELFWSFFLPKLGQFGSFSVEKSKFPTFTTYVLEYL